MAQVEAKCLYESSVQALMTKVRKQALFDVSPMKLDSIDDGLRTVLFYVVKRLLTRMTQMVALNDVFDSNVAR